VQSGALKEEEGGAPFTPGQTGGWQVTGDGAAQKLGGGGG
jgi:hypothetical protein